MGMIRLAVEDKVDDGSVEYLFIKLVGFMGYGVFQYWLRDAR